MGVHSLWQLLEKAERPVQPDELEGQILAVDVSIWLHQIVRAMRDRQGNLVQNAHVHALLSRLCKLLYHQIKPVFIFDGAAPAIKQQAVAERRRRITQGSDALQKAQRQLLHNRLKQHVLRGDTTTASDKLVAGHDLKSRHGESDMFDLPEPSRAQSSSSEDEGKESNDESEADDLMALKAGLPLFELDLDEDEDLADSLWQPKARSPVRRHASASRQRHPRQRSHRSSRPRRSPVALGELAQRYNQILADQAAERSDEEAAWDRDVQDQLATALSGSEDDLILIGDDAGDAGPGSTQASGLDETTLSPHASSPSQAPPHTNVEETPGTASAAQVLAARDPRGGFRAGMQYEIDTTTIDIFSHDFDQLPLEIQYEIIMERRELNKNRSRRSKYGGPSESNAFSSTQLSGVVQRNRLNKKLEDIRQALLRENNMNGLAVHKVVSEENTVFVLAERTDDLMPVPSKSSTPPPEAPSNAGGDPTSTSSRKAHAPEDSDRMGSNSFLLNQATAMSPPADEDDALSESSLSFAELDEDDEERLAEVAFIETAPVTSASKSSTNASADLVEPAAATTSLEAPMAPSTEPVSNPALPQHDSAAIAAAKEEEEEAAIGRQVDPIVKTLERGVAPAPSETDEALWHRPLLGLGQRIQAQPAAHRKLRSLILQGSDHESDAGSSSDEDASTVKREPVSEPTTDVMVEDLGDMGALPAQPAARAIKVEPESTPTVDPESSRIVTKPVQPQTDDESETDEVIVAHRVADVTVRPAPKVSTSQQPTAVARSAAADHAKTHTKPAMQPETEASLMAEATQLEGRVRRAARTAGDVTTEMIHDVQHMLMLFGCPYLIAPQEAESQCAQLELLGLTQGTITDDNDAFLFGAAKVYRHMCSAAKTPALFAAADLKHLLGMDREKLISLAYVLGSDYNAGIKGVGPVTGLEIIAEFPGGAQGMREFKQWLESCTGRTVYPPNQSATRCRLQKQLFGKVEFPPGFPNPLVEQAYLQPVVDKGEEAFSWGEIDLDGLRDFVHQKLGWEQRRADDYVVPVIRRANEKRSQLKIHQYFSRARLERPARRAGQKRPNVTKPSDAGAVSTATAADLGSIRLARAVERLKGGAEPEQLTANPESPRSSQLSRKRTAGDRLKKTSTKKMVVHTPYQLYALAMRASLREKGLKGRDLVKHTSLMWRSLADTDRAVWETKANEERAARLRRLAEAEDDEALLTAVAEEAEQELASAAAANTATAPAGKQAGAPPAKARKVLDADAFFDALHASPESVPAIVSVNRGPVLVLWATIVAKASGYAWSEGLTLGRALANAFAAKKGQHLGLQLHGGEEVDAETLAGQFPTGHVITFMGTPLAVVRQDGRLRAASQGRVLDPLDVLAHLRRKFGDALAVCVQVLQQLASAMPNPFVLQTEAYRLYLQFRPSVATGTAGWGQAGDFVLAVVRQLVHERLEHQQLQDHDPASLS